MSNYSVLQPVNTRQSSYQIQARAEQEKRRRANPDEEKPLQQPFTDWLYDITPRFSWEWQHLTLIRQHLENVTSGDCKRLMIFVPPRHGKSEMVTIRYPVWRLKNQPEIRVIIGAYNQTLANKFSRKARRIAGGQLSINTERKAVEDWETEQGGGVRAVGVGGGITGQGGDIIIIDDPVKNREEANSQVYRDKVWDWYTDDLFTRQEPGASIILIMTRWHEDDLAGRLLSQEAEKWEVISLPAIAEDEDLLKREIGAPLCPERFDLDALQNIKETLGNSWYALYQQRPLAPEGGMFKRAWFKIVPAVPEGAERVRYWDKAGTADGGAYTVGVLLAKVDKTFYVEDVIRGQWAAAERERVIEQTAVIDGKKVKIWVEQEPGSGGKESAEATIKRLAGFTAKADKVTGDKVIRAEPLAAQAEIGKVHIVKAPWNSGYLNELTSFPQGAYKDQVDGTSGAFNKMADTWRDIKFLKV